MDWSCSLMQAGRPYQDRLFPFGQFHHAIACSIRVNSIVRSQVPFPSILSGARGVRPYVSVKNSAIACSLLVNLIVRSLLFPISVNFVPSPRRGGLGRGQIKVLLC
jgi:hypothetical protein